MRSPRSCGHDPSNPLIDRASVKPFDPIALRAAAARSEDQGRRPVFRVTDTSSDDARPENFGRRRSLALDRSEHGGRLTAHRKEGSRAVLLVVTVLSACIATSIATCSAYAEPASRAPTGRVGDASTPSDPWSDHVADAAKRFAIPERWIRAVMHVESTNDMHAVSPKGAMGLMQLMPATWEEQRAKHGFGDDPFEPRDNILAGTAYLREMLDRFGRKGFLAAYNAGPGRYEEHLSRGSPLPPETVDFVAKLMPMIDGEAPVPAGSRRSGNSQSALRSPIFMQSGDGRNVDPTQADREPDAPSGTLFTAIGAPASPTSADDAIADLTAIEAPPGHTTDDAGTTGRPSGSGLFVRRSADSTP